MTYNIDGSIQRAVAENGPNDRTIIRVPEGVVEVAWTLPGGAIETAVIRIQDIDVTHIVRQWQAAA